MEFLLANDSPSAIHFDTYEPRPLIGEIMRRHRNERNERSECIKKRFQQVSRRERKAFVMLRRSKRAGRIEDEVLVHVVSVS